MNAICLLAVSLASGQVVTTSPGYHVCAKFRAVLHSPGGELPFSLEFDGRPGEERAWIVNGSERIEIPRVALDDGMVLSIDHYDSTIRAMFDTSTVDLKDAHRRWKGSWKKRVGEDKWARLDFSAMPWQGHRFNPLPKPDDARDTYPTIEGRWSVKFAKSEPPAVGIFKQLPNHIVHGTFLTTLGDYRYLEGRYEYGRLRLSCFDGAHAFLFDARMQPDGSLKGDFWSRDIWHETWTARRDDDAKLPDGFTLTKGTRRGSLKELKFPDLTGTLRSLDDPAFAGKARIIEVFATWCPNCNDASAYLTELDRRYRDRGLSIVGLAFEVTGDFKRDAKQIRRFAKRHKIKYPLLVGGLAGKKPSSAALPILDRVRAYPTTIFLRADGSIHAIHTGFSGPATGEEHRELRRRFESIIEELLSGTSRALQ